MLLSPRLAAAPSARRPEPPCASCLFDLAASSGMAGSLICPLKDALLRRLADPAIPAAACDAFLPGFVEDAAESPLASDATSGRRLS